MDWSRAKTILIITFVILNLFLIAKIQETLQRKWTYLEANQISDKQISQLLKDNHIKLNFLPPEQGQIEEMSLWKSTITKYDQTQWKLDSRGYYVKSFTPPIPVKDLKHLEQLLQEHVPNFGEYQLDPSFSPKNLSGKWIYLQRIDKGKLLFDGKLEVILENKRLLQIRIRHFDAIPSQIPVQNIPPFNNALFNLISEKKIKNATIQSAILGYRFRTNNDSSILVPVWRFQVNNHYYYVNATKYGSSEMIEVE